LEQKIIVLEQRVGRGEYNANTTKVVHLTMNPAATEATAREHIKLKRLEEEILRLKSIINKDNEKIGENANIDSQISQNKLDRNSNVIINNLKKKTLICLYGIIQQNNRIIIVFDSSKWGNNPKQLSHHDSIQILFYSKIIKC
jgi:predicted DNA-binding protein (UPF0251 family)